VFFSGKRFKKRDGIKTLNNYEMNKNYNLMLVVMSAGIITAAIILKNGSLLWFLIIVASIADTDRSE
jgi:hypothetical protein